MGKPILTKGGTILWAGFLQWLEQRKRIGNKHLPFFAFRLQMNVTKPPHRGDDPQIENLWSKNWIKISQWDSKEG